MSAETVYSITLQTAASFFLMMSAMFFFVRTPKLPVYASYRYARRLMGLAFLILTIHMLLASWQTGIFLQPFHALPAEVFFFLIEMVLFAHSFIHLLDHSYSSRKRLLRDLAIWLFTAILCVATLLLPAGVLRTAMTVAGMGIMMAGTVMYLVHLIKRLDAIHHRLEDYYVEDMYPFLRWITTSTLMLLSIGFTMLFVLYLNGYLQAAYYGIVILMNIYIVVSFHNYMHVYEEIDYSMQEIMQNEDVPEIIQAANADGNVGAAPDGDTRHTGLNDSQKSLLHIWVNHNGYCMSGLTLDALALEINSNRTYLSQYINETYNKSFSLWIAEMRINKAKQLLESQEENSMEQIAQSLGFSSGSYFTRVFSQIEGMTPTQWLRSHAKKDKA